MGCSRLADHVYFNHKVDKICQVEPDLQRPCYFGQKTPRKNGKNNYER